MSADPSTKRNRIPRWLGPALLGLGVLLLVIWSVRVVRAGMGLVQGARQATAMLDAGPSGVDLQAVGPLLRDVRHDTLVIKESLGWLAPLGPHVAWLPRVGPLLGEAPALLELGDALTALGVLLWRDVTPAVDAHRQGAPLPALLPDVVVGVSEGLPHKVRLAARAESAYAALDVGALPYRFREPVAKLGKLLPLLHTGLEFADRAPVLLGLDAPYTYLVLVLNEDELRPGGGFLTAAAEVRVVNGDLAAMVFQDAYAVDDFTQPYPDPPEPLRQMMGLDLWVFRDSNWSPDFPTAVQQAVALYRPGYPVAVDGVIGLDQHAVTHLVEALAPLSVPGQSEPVTGETVSSYIYSAWRPEDGVLDRDWWFQRKDFMGELAGAALEKVMSGDADYARLAEVAVAMLDERHLQVFVEDPPAAALLAQKGWDGGMPPAPSQGDFLGAVEASIGYNKASARIDRRLVYDVDLSLPSPVSSVDLHYENRNPVSLPCNPENRYDPNYEEMMDRCYWAHIRLYVPPGSVLQAASAHPIPADLVFSGRPWLGDAHAEEDDGYTVFSQIFLLPRGEAEVVRFAYELPPDVLDVSPAGVKTYRLGIRKQAGLDALEADVTLRLPDNAVVLSAHPQPVQLESGLFFYGIVSKTDATITLTYQIQEE